jgi:hypothetical protein
VKFIPITYEEALRVLFYSATPASLPADERDGTLCLVYRRASLTPLHWDALTPPPTPPWNIDLVAFELALRQNADALVARYPVERGFIVGIRTVNEAGVGTLHAFDPVVVMNDERELVYVPAPMGPALARAWRSGSPGPVKPTGKQHCGGDECEKEPYADDRCGCSCSRCGPWNEYRESPTGGDVEILGNDEAEQALRDWMTMTGLRAANLSKVWASDQRDEGPHQPWARARARFLSALLARGVLVPALELLPQWESQWWYDHVGYQQARPTDPPKPERCWSFPSPNGAPVVCGRALATIGTDRPNDAITCMDRHDCQMAAYLRPVLAREMGIDEDLVIPEDITRRTDPRSRDVALGELLGRVGIGETERAEILERCKQVLVRHEQAWKSSVAAVTSGNADDGLADVVSQLAFDAPALALILKRILAP